MRWPSPLSSRPCQRTTLLGANSRHDPAGTAAQSLHLKVSAVSPLRTQRVSSGASRSLPVKKLTGKVVKASTWIVTRTTVAVLPLAAPTPYSHSGLSSLRSCLLIRSRTSDAAAGMRTLALQQRDSRRRRSLQTCSSGRQAIASGSAPGTMTISCTAAAALATAAAAASGASFCTRISEKACAFSWMRASCAGSESSSPER